MRSFRGLGLIIIAALAVGAIAAGAAAQSGYNSQSYDYPTPPGGSGNNGPEPTLKLKVKANKPRVVLRRGIRVTATCNLPCIVKVRAYKKSRTYGTRTKRFPKKSGQMYVKLNKKAKKQIKKAVRAKRTFKFKVSGRATDSANRKSPVARATVKVKRQRKR